MTNQNSNKPVKTFMEKRQDEKRQKIKNNALYVTAYVILMFWGLWAIETGIFDTKLDGPEISGPTECPSNGKLIFDPKHKCYDEISLEEAKQRFGAKAAEKMQDVYYMTVEKDENSGKYYRKCYLVIDGRDFCYAQEDLDKLGQEENADQHEKTSSHKDTTQNNNGDCLKHTKHKRNNLAKLYNQHRFKLYQKTMLNKRIHNK